MDKLKVVLACLIAVNLLTSVGWYVAAPLDDELGLTLTQSGRSVARSWIPLLALSVVAATVGTAVAGRRLREAGAFAAGVGLTALSLRGGSMQTVLAYCGSNEAEGRRALMASLAMDGLYWAALMLIVWVFAVWAHRWLGYGRTPQRHPSAKPPDTSSDPKRNWAAAAITCVIGAIIISQTVGRTSVAEVARVQTIASVVGGLFVGAMIARTVTEVADARWYLLAVPAICLIGYFLGYINADMSWAEHQELPFVDLATTPPHAMVRVLPVDYIAAGVAGAIAGFWSGDKIQHVVE